MSGMSSQWVAVALSVLVVLGGTGLNLFVIGRFIGQWSTALVRVSDDLTKIENRMGEVEDRADATEKRVLTLQGELNVVNKAMDQFWELRDAFMKLSGVLELTSKHTGEQLDGLKRGQAVIERQLATIAKEGLHYRPGADQ